jgi:hypothetical protein
MNIVFGQPESMQGDIVMNETGIDLGAAIDAALGVTLKDFDVPQRYLLGQNHAYTEKEETKMGKKTLQPSELARVIASKEELEGIGLEHFREYAIVRLRERSGLAWTTTGGWSIHDRLLEPLKERDFMIGDTVVVRDGIRTRRMTVTGLDCPVLHVSDSDDSSYAFSLDCSLVEDYVGDTADSCVYPEKPLKTGDVVRYTQSDGVSVFVRLESDLGPAWNTNVGLVEKKHLSDPYPLREGDSVQSKKTKRRAVVRGVFIGGACLDVRFDGGSYDTLVLQEYMQPLEIQPNGCLDGSSEDKKDESRKENLPVMKDQVRRTIHGMYGIQYRPGWEPTEDQCRECCGLWKDRNRVTKVTLEFLNQYDSCEKFKEWAQHAEKIEGIPEQCIPKADPAKEHYAIRYPLLMGIMD